MPSQYYFAGGTSKIPWFGNEFLLGLACSVCHYHSPPEALPQYSKWHLMWHLRHWWEASEYHPVPAPVHEGFAALCCLKITRNCILWLDSPSAFPGTSPSQLSAGGSPVTAEASAASFVHCLLLPHIQSPPSVSLPSACPLLLLGWCSLCFSCTNPFPSVLTCPHAAPPSSSLPDSGSFRWDFPFLWIWKKS